MSLKEEQRVAKGGLSVAVMLKADFPQKATAGLELRVRDVSPDESPVQIHVFPQLPGDGGSSADVLKELNKDEVMRVQLPLLAGR